MLCIMPMFLWALTFGFFLLSIQFLADDFRVTEEWVGFGRQKKNLRSVITLLRELEETLAAGLVPAPLRWEALKDLSHPWRTLSVDSLKELRESGGALLPTLKRLRGLAESHWVSLEDARAKAAQAFAQALACSILVPVLGGALYLLLPGVEQHAKVWMSACAFALLLTLLGSVWLFKMAEAARWGGLSIDRRSWYLSAQCAGERFLALVRVGTPVDLSWVRACELLARDSADLAIAWGSSPWEEPKRMDRGTAERIIVDLGGTVKKALQVSLMEGRPCLERVESALLGLRQEMKAQVERELTLLPTRALKPLFICVAPALLSLLVCGLWFAASEALGLEDLSAY